MGVPNPASIDNLRVTDAMRVPGNRVVNLAPLSRYQNICCGVTSHRLRGEESPGTLNTLLRDIGVFMGRYDQLNQSTQKNVIVSPMDVAGPGVFLRSQISRDNVHPSTEFLTSLSCAVLLIRRKSQSRTLPMVKGMLPVGLPFSR